VKLCGVGVALIVIVGIGQAQKRTAETFRNAQRLYESGQLADAERSFTETVRNHPDNFVAQIYLGQSGLIWGQSLTSRLDSTSSATRNAAFAAGTPQ